MSLIIMKKPLTDQKIANLHHSLQTIATQANILRSICENLTHDDGSNSAFGALAIAEKIGYLSDRAIGYIDGDEGGDCIGGGEEWFMRGLPTEVIIDRRYEATE